MVLSAKLRNRRLATPCTNYGTVGENMESGVLFIAYLLGTNTITDIQFIKKLPKLKTFICDYKVKDGDVHPCGLINGYVYIQNRKNFNTKEYGDDNYPRTIPSKEEGIYVGQENIELWRRLWSSPQWPGEM